MATYVSPSVTYPVETWGSLKLRVYDFAATLDWTNSWASGLEANSIFKYWAQQTDSAAAQASQGVGMVRYASNASGQAQNVFGLYPAESNSACSVFVLCYH